MKWKERLDELKAPAASNGRRGSIPGLLAAIEEGCRRIPHGLTASHDRD
jgi:hypothetical protein